MNLSDLVPLNPDFGASLINAARSEAFAEILFNAANTVSGVEEVFGYVAHKDGRPDVIVAHSTLDGASERVRQYVKRFFRHDPAVSASRNEKFGFSRRIRINEIIPYDYRRLCFEEPRFQEKLSFGWRLPDGLAMLSFYKRGEIDEHAALNLTRIADVSLAALRHAQKPPAGAVFIETLEARLRHTHPELTMRENQVCARTVAGWTAEKIAKDLGVKASSVLTYRQRAYRRMNIAAANALLPELLH
ncbi:MAG: LuxR C-terminal-related transcriptional regulator [Parvularculaceae bacterium]